MNGPALYTCKCMEGYFGDGVSCQEINGCDAKPCDVHATCSKTGPGHFRCTCNRGFKGDGKRCAPVNACKSIPYPCDSNADCRPTGGGTFACHCRDGFKGDGNVCEKILPPPEPVHTVTGPDPNVATLIKRIEEKLNAAEGFVNVNHQNEQDQGMSTLLGRLDSLEKTTDSLRHSFTTPSRPSLFEHHALSHRARRAARRQWLRRHRYTRAYDADDDAV